MNRKNSRETIHPTSISFPVIAEGYEPALLGPEYLNLLQKDPSFIEPALVLRGVHTIAEGLLGQSEPAQIDSDFTGSAYQFFLARGTARQQKLHSRLRGKRVEPREEIVRRGWSLLIAEDVFAMESIIDERRNPARRASTGGSHLRSQAHKLLLDAGDTDGTYVNATQGVYSNRMRGIQGLPAVVSWFGKAVVVSEKVSIRTKRVYMPAGFNTITSRSVAIQAFLANTFSHDGTKITG